MPMAAKSSERLSLAVQLEAHQQLEAAVPRRHYPLQLLSQEQFFHPTGRIQGN